MDDSAYFEVNRKWKAVCRILLGEEVGELKEYEKWLSENNGLRILRKSSVSGKEVVLAETHYPPNSNYIALKEVNFEKRYGQLDINKIKDTDSIIEAVSERICYCGDIILGNSDFVEKSTSIFDSFYILNSGRLTNCKYIAYSTIGSFSENMFGSNGFGRNAVFSIKANGINTTARCLEISKTDHSSDCYYSHGLSGCQNCMFCFNVKNKKYAIGNMELPPQKYLELKKKLATEIREKLAKEKRLPSLVEIAAASKPDYFELNKTISLMKQATEKPENKAPIERAFSNATSVIFKKRYEPIDKYAEWLERYTAASEKGKSCESGRPILVQEYSNYLLFPRDRLVTLEEAEYLNGKLQIEGRQAERLTFANVPETISKIAYFCLSWPVGISQGNIDCQVNIDSTNCYKSIPNLESKLCAYNFWVRNSENIFGSNEVRFSSFCLKCYHSGKLSRCFEVDASNNCSDCLFCHNCENLHDSMFCFNVKNKRYAIGNVELPMEKYKEIKKKVIAQLNEMLEKENGIGLSVLTLPQARSLLPSLSH